MNTAEQATGTPQPSPWYLLTLALGCAGLAFLFMAVWAAWQVEAREEATSNAGNFGALGLTLGFAILFADRAARWEQLGAGLRSFVSGAIALVLWLAVAATAYAAYLAFVATGAANGTVDTLAVFACLCAVATLFWLLRLRSGAVRR